MAEKIRYALIGCGRIAPNHIAAALANVEALELCAVCDPVEENMERVLEQAPEAVRQTVTRYTNYEEMLEKERPILVAIATESGRHAAIGLRCIAAGCNLIIEKPIALSIADADALIEAAESKGVQICACHQNRFNKSIQKIRQAVEAGQFGRMLHGTAHIRWNRNQNYYTQAPWRGTWEQDGGALMNQCIHNIDLLRWMMGDEVEEVFAYTDNLNHPYIAAEDLGLAVVRFKGGAYGLIEGTTNIYPSNLEETLYLFGEKGTVKAGGKSVNVIEEWRFEAQTEDPEAVKARFHENPPNVYGFGHTPLYRDVIAALGEGRAPYVDGYAGKRALEMVLAIYQSAATGKPVHLPLKECATTDFIGRFGR
ncbi:Gfo/Idh/MocA family oxidoreductase [Christensenellaceae bacterium NSJ-44]|uniref:Gfo/Idh/MocA family oxidoreductase n=1 Tax=Luoshenia tenuis TaxID=2763654 RepID=A0A926D1K1_9FIRM|nr:Gfo/Idh/MocA family oxidoreductase [Luoshenia tenuis]MBC8529573.1 Gfo/Idh/MocA family oxidoreductase [Luoshenia tenuis]